MGRRAMERLVRLQHGDDFSPFESRSPLNNWHLFAPYHQQRLTDKGVEELLANALVTRLHAELRRDTLSSDFVDVALQIAD